MLKICHLCFIIVPHYNKKIRITNNISFMFYNCKLIKSLPSISKWNTNNVKNMSHMFSGCKSLKSIRDISKWNTNNVNDMSDMC